MEAEKLIKFNVVTTAIYKNVMLFAMAGLLAAIFGFIPMMGWVVNICNILLVAGFIAFLIRIKDMAIMLEAQDAESANKLCNGVLIYLLSIMLGFIPAAGWILEPIAVIVSCVFMLMGIAGLKKSSTFPGAPGMKILFIAMIVGIVGGVFGIIPVVGLIIARLCRIAFFIMMIIGWKKVAEPVAE